MASLDHVRYLVLDPCILIGSRRCPARQDATELRPPSMLASMMPRSLEHLAILVDWDQAARVPDYRSSLLEGFITEKKQGRLPHLVQVILLDLEEPQGYYNEDECDCASDPLCPTELENAGEGSSEILRPLRKRLQGDQAWKDVGIEVDLISEYDVERNTKEWQNYEKTFHW